MPRVGRHPLKNKEIKDLPLVHQNVTVTTIVYIPMLAGYWQESLDVLKLFFDSLYTSTSQPFDLMVFDNGSCEEVKYYLLELQAAGKIQYLILSTQNLRKLGALNYLLSAAPGEFVAYADSDVYFLPGWLEESIKVLTAFPEAGKVTALPIVGGDTTEISKQVFDLAQADSTITVQTGLLVPEQYIEAHRVSLGLSIESYAVRLKNRKDTLLQRSAVDALLSGADFQFVMPRAAVQAVLPLRVEKTEEYYDPIYSPVLEYRLEGEGYWQLSTPLYYIHHMGNHVPDIANELPWLSDRLLTQIGILASHTSAQPDLGNLFNRFLRISFIHSFLKKIHTISYKWLYEQYF